MSQQRVPVVEQILSANDRLANQNRAVLDEAGVFAIKSEFFSESEYQDYDALIDTYDQVKVSK